VLKQRPSAGDSRICEDDSWLPDRAWPAGSPRQAGRARPTDGGPLGWIARARPNRMTGPIAEHGPIARAVVEIQRAVARYLGDERNRSIEAAGWYVWSSQAPAFL